MQFRYTEYDDFIVVNKGFGLRTHRVSDGQFGLVEYLSEKLNQNLFVVHRLDKETSGLMLFAKNKLAAQKISELFEKHQIQKSYYFLTDHKKSETKFTVKSFIDKEQNKFVQKDEVPENSETHFEFLEKLGDYFLWKAHPTTGKPHQIRLHAEKAKINILGDNDHGGSPFFRLALHSGSISFALNSEKYDLQSELPQIFKESSDPAYEYLLQACFEKRNQLYKISEYESYRLVHLESEKIRADIFKDHLWVYDYSEKGLSDSEKKSIHAFAVKNNLKPIIRHMLDRGTGVGGLEKSTLETNTTDSKWLAQEESIQYVLKTDSGFSPGLFLDQRENRLWVRTHSENKSVLNLFSYTSGFSVAAGLGKAHTVTTVDVSAKFLNWSKENFEANQLEIKKYEFFAQDCLLFLKGAVKRNRKWDLIICDPPTFGRSKDSVWKIERDLPELARLLFQCLEKNGQILFTCNYEKMNRDELLKLFLKKIKSKHQISRLPQLSLDYEHTDDLKNLMKGFCLTKI
jgi:23S rRNA (cytosine1962-C5)-methyltransferase